MRPFVVLAALSAMALAVSGASASPVARVVVRREPRAESGERVEPKPAPPAPPRGPKLTVEPLLQQAAERILERSRAPSGAIVVSDVRTGRILVYASRGPFDAAKTPFAPSASVFKVVTSAAMLDSGRVSPSTRQCYAGGGEHGITELDIKEDARQDRYCLPLADALSHSVNLVVARMALKHIAPQALRTKAAEMGFGAPLPIDIETKPSVVTIPEDRLGFARASAGFWNGQMSALQSLFLMQTIANRGEKIRMHLLDHGAPPPRVSLGMAMRPSSADELRHMLEGTVKSGTCTKAFHDKEGRPLLPGVSVAAKTGTLIGGRPSRMYSWFAGFAPSNHPEIAISVLLADDVSWWMKANVAGRQMLEAYFAATRRH